MTLDQLQAAVEQARRSGARGDELIRARMYGRRGGLRSITLDLAEPAVAEPAVAEPEPTAEAPQPNPPAARTRRR